MVTPSHSFSKIFPLLLASSRPLQATLSIAQPLFAAFLSYGAFIPLPTLALLALGSVAGMFAVFALNDFLDYPLDHKNGKTKKGKSVQEYAQKEWDVDAVMQLHPYAAGMISREQQIVWIGLNFIIAAIILYTLSPIALGLFILACVLELVYCKLATHTEWKTIVAGLLVAIGSFIGWFAVGGSLNYLILAGIGLVFFFWEIGGRNIPNDLSDIESDSKKGITTLPTIQGSRRSAWLIGVFSILTILSNLFLEMHARLGNGYWMVTTLAGIVFLAIPARMLLRNPTPSAALKYFNKATLFPVFLLGGLLLSYWAGRI